MVLSSLPSSFYCSLVNPLLCLSRTCHFSSSLARSACLSSLSYSFILIASLPTYSLFPSVKFTPPLFLSPLYHNVFAPDASCLSSVGRVSVMAPSRNSKHHSGIFFQAIAFCSNKGGVALASLTEWTYWP